MRRLRLAAALALASSLPASAIAEVGPSIAYAQQSSNRWTIYLINPDGTGLSRLYNAAAKQGITALDLKPGGGEIAFIERYALKVLRFDERGVAIGSPRTIATPCLALAVDYHPADGSLAVLDECSPRHIWRLASGASAVDATPLVTGTNIVVPRWSRDGSHLYYRSASGLMAYYPSNDTSVVVDADPIATMTGVTTTGDRAILEFGAPYPDGTYKIQDFASGEISDGCTLAKFVRFGNGDRQMVYRTASARLNATYLMIHNSDCSGAPLRLTGKGTYSALDWRTP